MKCCGYVHFLGRGVIALIKGTPQLKRKLVLLAVTLVTQMVPRLKSDLLYYFPSESSDSSQLPLVRFYQSGYLFHHVSAILQSETTPSFPPTTTYQGWL